jgi:peptidoglycan hydrolase CwlO-like protein
MQKKELSLATSKVADIRVISGRATADEMNRSLRTGKRLARMGGLAAFIAAGLLVAVAPLAAKGDDDKDSRHGREDNDTRAQIAALQAQVASLQSIVSALQDQVNTLKTANTGLQTEINSLQTSNTTLQTQLAAVQSNHALLLGPFVNVDPNPEIGVIGPNIIFQRREYSYCQRLWLNRRPR